MDQLISSLVMLFQDTARNLAANPRPGHAQFAMFLRDFQAQRLMPLFHRTRALANERYVVSMIGLTNVGKSTLAQALLREPVAPRRNGAATAVPVEYEKGDSWSITSYHTGLHIKRETFDDATRLSVRLRQLVFDVDEHAAKSIIRIIVRGPLPGLPEGLVLVDMPGCGAAEAITGPEQDAEIIQYVRTHVNEVLFCVRGDANNWKTSPREVEFFRDLQDLCSTVVVTRWESNPEKNEEEMAKFQHQFSHLFPLCQFLFVQAKWAIHAYQKKDEQKLVESNIDSLHALIEERASITARQRLHHEQVVHACDDFAELAREPLRQAALRTVPWRSDKLENLKATQGAHELILRITP
ncbi:dynamin family protein [Verrucomicrobium spinosum]|uniref:dynamin family protein n=1 Tax=Verrucomicrobium spinosum TaxID=2736 RepID=UPI0001744318|nr:dynamin family protein [Verrucomicrobium spinosum]